MTPTMILGLVGALILLIGNTMIAIAFLHGRGANLRSSKDRARESMDELHRRVQSLPPRST